MRYRNVKRVYGYKLNSYWSNIASVDDYFRTNMDFLKPDVRKYFFREEPKIYSKVDDLPPAKYNMGSDVSNSLIASGCIINGRVENSVLFKKVFVGKNCVIKNSIILNDAYIGDNTQTALWSAMERFGQIHFIPETMLSGLLQKTTKDICSRERLEGGYICRLQTLESARWKKKAR